MLDNLPADMTGESLTPAAEGMKLDENRSDFFNHNVEKPLFLCKHA
jgi:hypothetical protein